MALILKKLVQGYFSLFRDKIDSRSDHFYLVSSPFQPLLIGLAYLYLIYEFLPKFMKNRPPYNMNKVLIVFNFTQVLINAYIFYSAAKEAVNLNWSCTPIDYSDTPHNKFVLKMAYVYFLTKVADLLDTVFFLLRGKKNQVSFLHVYHHFGMIGLGWVGVRFLGGGHSIFVGLVNTFVHTIMYFYYLISAWYPEYKRNFWWKKHITQLQLIQFVFFFFMYGQLLFRKDCPYPKIVSYCLVPQSMFMMILFGDFYWKAYVKPQKTQKSQ